MSFLNTQDVKCVKFRISFRGIRKNKDWWSIKDGRQEEGRGTGLSNIH